ncbi:hypothetical protein HPB50_020855 [Hyalomma asiaticum]|uniref:Uncharacterized protein n=1 Tax=Hyalomma asiaticum TaxID=266040 RepID=A0ACB7RUQ5_HYAAI|nr:hypothetical protein HPB50_020855 [Hyalomma asiaticum]
MDRCKSRRRLYFDDMEEPSPVTKPQFRPTRRYDSGELAPLEDCDKFLEGHWRYTDDARKKNKAVAASMPYAMTKCHTVSVGVKSRAAPLASRQRCSNTLSGRPRVEGSSQLAAGGWPRIARQHFQSSQPLILKSMGVDEPLLCQATAKGRKEKRKREAMSTDDVIFEALSRRSKTSRLEVPFTSGQVHVCRKNSEPQVPTGVGSKRRTSMFTDGAANVKAQLSLKKSLRLEPHTSKTFGPKRDFKELAEVQEPIAAGLKGEDVRLTKRTGCGPQQRACAGDGRMIDPRRMAIKPSTSVLANVTLRMAPSDRHRRCFEETTNSDWPRRRSDVPRNRDKTTSAKLVALGSLAHRKRGVRKIDFSYEAVASSSPAAVQEASRKDVVPFGGVGQFLVSALKFLFSSLLSRVVRFFTGALY